MKVLLVANYEPDAQQSMLRYAEFLRRELSQRGFTMDVIQPPVHAGRLLPRSHPLAKWLGYIDKYLLFPRQLQKLAAGYDLVHICDHSNAVYVKWAGDTPSLVTAHDMLAILSAQGRYPQNPTKKTGQWLQAWILRGLNRARCIVSVSEKTKRDLDGLLQSKPLISVIHHALNWSYSPASEAEIAEARAACGLSPGDEYLLHVGGNHWYKNRTGVLRIFAELRRKEGFRKVKLVLAGEAWMESMREICREQGITDAIEVVSPSNETVRALYTGALAFLFPSLEEGFGWPILEAQACGALVITSARAPMDEVAGAGAIYIDPENPVQAAGVIAERMPDAEAIRAAGWKNLERFTLESVMKRYVDAYHEAAAIRP
ncbi:glycosyltransferase family 4 protein [Silvibacterium sp.]|uniref:glycosyltransferase family 4 protein n=1 Tax=Silvibacterium sp. TaxID=1964179 RepID=UPI0039E672E2